ncbi:MAG TPA: hypothetical protein VKS60_26355 [Stellaceae bacterium]|nr:hypothetical protein [Stellaceae bacterium]
MIVLADEVAAHGDEDRGMETVDPLLAVAREGARTDRSFEGALERPAFIPVVRPKSRSHRTSNLITPSSQHQTPITNFTNGLYKAEVFLAT